MSDSGLPLVAARCLNSHLLNISIFVGPQISISRDDAITIFCASG